MDKAQDKDEAASFCRVKSADTAQPVPTKSKKQITKSIG
jgi:hypothetical protein